LTGLPGRTPVEVWTTLRTTGELPEAPTVRVTTYIYDPANRLTLIG
jgi:hypothetical protein